MKNKEKRQRNLPRTGKSKVGAATMHQPFYRPWSLSFHLKHVSKLVQNVFPCFVRSNNGFRRYISEQCLSVCKALLSLFHRPFFLSFFFVGALVRTQVSSYCMAPPFWWSALERILSLAAGNILRWMIRFRCYFFRSVMLHNDVCILFYFKAIFPLVHSMDRW